MIRELNARDPSGALLPISGLTAADVPAEVTPEASKPNCCEGAAFSPGFGYAGGGFGSYKRCQGCGQPFAKMQAR